MNRVSCDALSIEELVACVAAERDEARLRDLLARHAAYLDQPECYDALKAEADRHWMIDPHVSLHLAEAMVVAGELGAYPAGQALGLLARGNALVYLGRFHEAIEALDASGERFRSSGDAVGWARTRLSWIVASHRLGLGKTVFPVVEEARAILSDRGEWRHLAWLDTNTAYVAHELGQVSDAERLLANAQRLFEQLGPAFAGQVAVVQANRGIMHTFLGNFAQALLLHEQAQRTAIEQSETITALRQEQNIGLVYAAQGRYTLALQRYTVAYEGFRKANLDTSVGWVALNMLECQLALNRYQEALALAEETTAIFARHAAPAEAAKAQVLAARAHARLGDEAAALACLDQAAAAFAGAGLAAQEAHVALQRGAFLLEGEQWAETQLAVGTARRVFAEQGDALRRAGADLIHARAALGLGDVNDAEALGETIVRQAATLDHAELAASAHHLLGQVAAVRGAADGGMGFFRQALADVERAQRVLALDLSSSYLGDKLALYHDAIATSLRLGRADEAFGYLERAKARVLADYLAHNFQVRLRAQALTDPALLADLEQVRAEHNWLSQRRYGDNLSQQIHPEQRGDASDAELQAAIAQREREMGRLLEQLALARTEG
ncbi:MAG: tetratricopeptide repeat protein [Chloroflexia bacterium]